MQYYELHENKYKKCFEQNISSWDEGLGQAPDFESFCLRPFLVKAMQQSLFSSTDKKGLELGCGTGPACCFLSQQGFQMEGIDISTTAITIAKKEAEQRQLSIQYQAVDLCQTNLPKENYDIILDGHCLHCIVFEQERTRLYQNIHQALKPTGYFWIATMVGNPEVKWKENFFYDEEGILWFEWNKDPAKYPQAKEIHGRLYLPQRRIYPKVSYLLEELEKNHFQVIWSELEKGNNGEPDEYFAVCQPLKKPML